MTITSEDHLLACLWRHFPKAAPQLLVPNGDDCAVLRDMGPLCVSTDLFLEDAHFRRSYFTPAEIGHKALAVNLSDLAACGALPVGFTMGLALPRDADMAFADQLFAGMAALGAEHNIPLVGGDLSRGDKLHLCLTVFGSSQAPGGGLQRRQAQEGDLLFLLGQVGLARVGLERLEAVGRAALDEFPEACAAHLLPQPRVREGLRLAALALRDQLRLSLMDVSDGLARDLPRLVGPELGADITLPHLRGAGHPELVRHARATGADPALMAFLGGEDYALAGTCPSGSGAALMAVLPEAAILGSLRPAGTVPWTCNGRPMNGGFDHFASDEHTV